MGPDTMLTFGPDGHTGHRDHQAVASWTAAAFDHAAPDGARLLQVAVSDLRVPHWKALNDRLGAFLPGYPIAVPAERLAVDLELDPTTAVRKVRALAAQATQTGPLIEALGLDRYTRWVGAESFVERARPVP